MKISQLRNLDGWRKAPYAKRGIMLIDCLVYITLWSLVLGLAIVAYHRYDHHSRRLARNANDIVQVLNVGEMWREDVRSAQGPIQQKIESEYASIEIPQAKGVVRYDFRAETISRIVSSTGQEITLLRRVKQSRMIKDQGEFVASWRWELELEGHSAKLKIRPLFTFQATPSMPKKTS
jgi:hypothetical protein